MESNYLILGASSDTALSYIKHLDESGKKCHIIAFCYSSSERIEALKLDNITIQTVICDLGDCEAVEKTITGIMESNVRITHVLHFAAGKLIYEKAGKFSYERLNENFRIQVCAIAIILKYVLPAMKKQKFGRVVITTSSCTIGAPPKYMSEYTMIKYALVGLIKSYAVEYFGKNVTVNGIAPAMMETRFWDTVSPHIAELNKSVQPCKQCISPNEVNECIDYLCSESASFVTGENINLSGGQVM